MKTIILTDEELRALKVLLWCNPCSCGCAYTEMQKSNIECDECNLTKSIGEIQIKAGLI